MSVNCCDSVCIVFSVVLANLDFWCLFGCCRLWFNLNYAICGLGY